MQSLQWSLQQGGEGQEWQQSEQLLTGEKLSHSKSFKSAFDQAPRLLGFTVTFGLTVIFGLGDIWFDSCVWFE